jgi:transposase
MTSSEALTTTSTSMIFAKSLKPFYSQIGRSSVDPELMIRLLIVGYCRGIRSERRLCEDVHLNLAYRWFCRHGLDGRVPNHSTFSKNRRGRFRESDTLRRLFESVVQRCIAEGLVSADGFAADANKQRPVPNREWRPEEIKEIATRAAQEYFATLDGAAFGAASPVTPKFISRSDPEAQWSVPAAEPARGEGVDRDRRRESRAGCAH